MKKIFLFLLIACNLAVYSGAGLAELEVNINQNKEKNFAQYRTFAWLPEDRWVKHLQKKPNPGMYRIITEAVNKDLVAKGYSPAPFEEADLIVVYTGSLEQKESVSKAGFGRGQEYFGSRVRINQFGNVRSIPDSVWDDRAYTTYYSEGKLMIDFYDRKTKDLVWRGTGLKNVKMETPVFQIEEKNVTDSINTIMKKFPEVKES